MIQRLLVFAAIGLVMNGANRLVAEEPVAPPETEAIVIVEDPPIPPFVVAGKLPVVKVPPPVVWSRTVEAGLNGAQGNSELVKLRMAGTAKREGPGSIFANDFMYNFASANNQRTENRALANSRMEWIWKNSKWSPFVSGQLEFDDFKAYDLRLANHAGFGYQWIKNPATQFKTRIGAGGSRELGGPDNRFMPEALLGAEVEQKITERQKLTSAATVYPDLGEFGEYRAIANFAYEILVDPEWNLTLKFGALDRYDSTPQGRRANDIEYFAVLMWKF